MSSTKAALDLSQLGVRFLADSQWWSFETHFCGSRWNRTVQRYGQKQRGPTTDLRAILQKRDNLRATSNKMM